MKKSSTVLTALAVALLLASGAARAQFKAPTRSPSKDGLGSGIGTQSYPAPVDPTVPTAPTTAPAAPATAPAAPATTPAAPGATSGSAPTTAPAEDKETLESVVQQIGNCVLAGLPADWQLAQVDVRELGRTQNQREFEAMYSYKDAAGKSASFSPCDPREPALNVYKLNGALEPAKRNWTRATLVLSKEGKFELQYDYTPQDSTPKPAPAEAKKDAKKGAKKDAKK